MEAIKIPSGASDEARICLTCTEKKCTDALHCKRFESEKKKLGRKTKNNKPVK